MEPCRCCVAQARPPLPAPPFRRFSQTQAIASREQFSVRLPRLCVKCSIFSDDNVSAEDGSGEWKEDAIAGSARTQRWQWAMTVSYDGTRFSGWQIQPRAITVQKTIEAVLSQITRSTEDELSLTAASRTDAGVHAWGQVVSFTTPFAFEHLDILHRSLNSMLPPDVRIREVKAVRPGFHVRYHPISKTYQYKAYIAPVMDPCKQSYAVHLPYVINVNAMQEAASLFIGVHNFAAFANSSPKKVRSPIREIHKFTVLSSGPNLLFEVQGQSFLYKQVRNMVGLLIKIGQGTLPSSAVSDVLSSKSRQMLAELSETAPAHGLYLMSVDYDAAHFLEVNLAFCLYNVEEGSHLATEAFSCRERKERFSPITLISHVEFGQNDGCNGDGGCNSKKLFPTANHKTTNKAVKKLQLSV